MGMTNRWNRLVYRTWAPVYDGSIGRFFVPGRKRAMEVLSPEPGERVLLVGVGTGADLPLLSAGVEAVGVDLSSDMLARARAKLPLPGRDVKLIQGDAQKLSVGEGEFDAAVLNLILSVVPDGARCLRSTLQALKPGGRAVVVDKFLPDEGELTPTRRVLNSITSFFGTDITRRFGDLVEGSSCTKIHDEPSILGGAYRVILLRKDEEPS